MKRRRVAVHRGAARERGGSKRSHTGCKSVYGRDMQPDDRSAVRRNACIGMQPAVAMAKVIIDI